MRLEDQGNRREATMRGDCRHHTGLRSGGGQFCGGIRGRVAAVSRSMRYLTVQEVLFVHFQVVERFGGLQGVLNLAGLESRVARPHAAMGGGELYVSTLQKELPPEIDRLLQCRHLSAECPVLLSPSRGSRQIRHRGRHQRVQALHDGAVVSNKVAGSGRGSTVFTSSSIWPCCIKLHRHSEKRPMRQILPQEA